MARISSFFGTYHHTERGVDDQVGQSSTEHGILGVVVTPLQARHLDDE
jgi:hypothetical protein